MWIIIVQRMAIEFILDILYFPIWWYSGGVKHTGVFCLNLFRGANNFLAPGLWLQNITVPMFGQYDWQGRLVSFFMRLINVIGRSIALLFVIFFILGIFFLWLIFPVFVVIMFGVALLEL